MNIAHYSVLLLGAILGAIISPALEQRVLLNAVFFLLVLLIVLGLVALVESRGVKFVGLFRWGGVFRLVPENWSSPAPRSWRTVLAFCIAGLILGGLVRVLFIVKA